MIAHCRLRLSKSQIGNRKLAIGNELMSTVIEPPLDQLEKQFEELETVTIRFAGDSGDGMQLTGTQFTNTSAVVGNDISTLPDFPAEIRAPAGSLPGVSGFQLNFSSQDIRTPGDQPNVLVAMNPAALKVNLGDLEEGGTLIIPGHGRVCDEFEVSEYRDMLVIIRDRVQAMINKGATVEQVKAAQLTYDYDDRFGATTGPWTTDMFVEAAYTSLKQGRPTTTGRR